MKKFISLVLVLIMITSLVPPSVLALDDPEEIGSETGVVVDVEESDTSAENEITIENEDDEQAGEPANEAEFEEESTLNAESEENGSEEFTTEPNSGNEQKGDILSEEGPGPETEKDPVVEQTVVIEEESVAQEPVLEAQNEETTGIPAEVNDSSVTIISEDGTISVKGTLPADVTVSADPIKPVVLRSRKASEIKSGSGELDLNKKESSAFAAVYDIKLLDTDGTAIQPDQAVTVTIDNVAVGGPTATIYHILEEADAVLRGLEEGNVYPVTSGALFSYATEKAFNAAFEATGEERTIYVEILTGVVDNKSVSFVATSFSVYAVEGDNNRLLVRFHQANSEDTVDILVKKNDDLSTILYDPGVGTLQGAQLFKGWSINGTYQGKTYDGPDYDEESPAMTVETLREYVTTLLPPTSDETVLEVWPVILKGFNVTYKDEQGVTIETISILIKDAESAEYTIDKSYIPMLQDEAFMGWRVDPSTQGNVTAAVKGDTTYSAPFEGPYENGTVLTIKGSIILEVNVPKGYWLVFRENGKGARYTSPQFIRTGEHTVRPEDPTRFGYEFVDWFEAEVDAQGKPLTDENGDVILKTAPFVFDTAISERKTVYAKWEPVGTAKYTIIIWKQDVSDNKNATDNEKHYDFAESITIEGTVGSIIDSVSQQGTGNNAYARVNGSNKRYEGFHLNRFDQNVKIIPEGTSVLNIYYDRNLVTLTYQVWKNSGGAYTATTNTTGELYGKDETTGEYFRIYSDDGTHWYSSQNNDFEETEELTEPLYALVNGEYVLLEHDNVIGWYYPDHQNYAANEVGSDKYGYINGEYILLTYRDGRYYYISGTEIVYVTTNSNSGTQYRLLDNGQYEQIFFHDGWFSDYWFYYSYTASTANEYIMYGLVDGEYVLLTRRGGVGNRWYEYNGERYNGTRYLRSEVEYNGTRYIRTERDVESEYTDTLYTHNIPYAGPYYKRVATPYTGTRYIYSGSSGWNTVHQFTGLYGSTLVDNGYSWPTDYWWYDNYTTSYGQYVGSGTRTTFLDAFILSSGGSEETFYGFTGTGTNHIYFYKQNADGNTYPATATNTVTSGNGTFYISDKYNGFKAAAYSTDGTTWTPLGDKNDQGYYGSVGNYTNLYIRYERLQYNMQFMDGVYVDGNGTTLQSYSSRGQLKVVNDITYGSSIASYNKGNTDYYEPTFDGFVFEGWYLDDHCLQPYTFTTMQEGVTVYAKWRQIQYRVFLHPNVIESEDPSLDMGDQSTSFRVAYGDTIDSINAVRDEYELIGWYTDPALTQAFNFDSYVINNDTVKTPYNKTEDTELTTPYGTVEAGKEGINNDATGYNGGDRFWITRKLDLYAKWRSILVGALGINVVYESGNEGYFEDAEHNHVSTYDDVMIYKDLATAYGQAAPKANDPTTTQFKYWDLQKYVDGEFISSGEKVYPGDTYVVRKAYAEQTANDDNTPDNPSYTYTVKLVAVYGPIEAPSETAVRFDPNGGAFADASGYKQSTYIVNEDITFPGNPQRDHYEFIGWAGSETAEAPDISIEDMQTKTYAADNLEGLAWCVHDDSLDRDINVLYAVWEEDQATINYVVAGPTGIDPADIGTVTLNKSGAVASTSTSEQVGVETGVPVGATAAVVSSTYRFIGWFDNATGEGTPLSTDPSYVPTKQDNAIWNNPITYYAVFEYNLTQLKITKTGMQANENAVFTVSGEGIENGITVVVKNGETVTIDGVYVGESYIITEIDGWTWRYTTSASSVSKVIAAPPAENLVTFTNTLNNNHWLTGESKEHNVFDKAPTPTD